LERMRFFICTRNRPQTVLYSVASLVDAYDSAFPYVKCQIFIVDDSSSTEYFETLETALQEKKFSNAEIIPISRGTRYSFVDSLKAETSDDKVQSAIEYFFGTDASDALRWDVSRVRNYIALLAYGVSREGDIIVFLDDDIVLTNVNYDGKLISVSGSRVLRDVCAYLRNSEVIAVGCGYWGRIDVSVIEHISKACDVLSVELRDNRFSNIKFDEVVDFPNTLPVFIEYPSGENAVEMQVGPGGISAAFIALRREQLRTHGFIRCYNEDWIWQLYFDPQKTMIKLDQRLIHAPPRKGMVETAFACYQEFGEIVFTSLEAIMHNFNSGSNLSHLDLWYEKITPELIEVSRQQEIARVKNCIQSVQKLQLLIEKQSDIFGRNGSDLVLLREAVVKMNELLRVTEQYVLNLDVNFIIFAIQRYVRSNQQWSFLIEPLLA